MVFAGCSSFVRELIERTTEGCSCEAITLYLPDYSADTVRNLLSILYTGETGVMLDYCMRCLKDFLLYKGALAARKNILSRVERLVKGVLFRSLLRVCLDSPSPAGPLLSRVYTVCCVDTKLVPPPPPLPRHREEEEAGCEL